MNLELMKENFGKYVEGQGFILDELDGHIDKLVDLMARITTIISKEGGKPLECLAMELIELSNQATILNIVKKMAEEGDSSE